MSQRLEKVRNRLGEFGLDALLVTSLENIRYLFGFTGSNAIVLVASDLCFFVTDRRYNEQVRHEVSEAEIRIANRELIDELVDFGFLKGKRVGVETEHLSTKHYFELRKRAPHCHLVGSERIVEGVASRKSEVEVDTIRRAGSICKSVFEEVLSLVKEGVTESEIAAELTYRTRRAGSARDPFAPIVASGPRSALPHGGATDKKIAAGELVIMDFGATVDGYCADITRTLIVGSLSTRQNQMVTAVKEALESAEKAAKVGMSGRALDAVARGVIGRMGLGERFIHSLGHGIGIRVHELPRIGERSKDLLESGHVFTLEPGVYEPEVGGVRIEDDFYLGDSGLENLTPFTREVVSVG